MNAEQALIHQKYVKYADPCVKHLVNAFMRNIERNSSLFCVFPQCIMDISLLFYYEYSAQISDDENNLSITSPLLLLCAIYNSPLLLQFVIELKQTESIKTNMEQNCLLRRHSNCKLILNEIEKLHGIHARKHLKMFN